MQRVVRKHLWIAAVALLGIATTTAWAGLKFTNFPTVLHDIDGNGNPAPGGSPTNFDALFNTCTGDVIGTAQTQVRNDSHRWQIYLDNPRSAFVIFVTIYSSLYIVSDQGDAFLIATGRTLTP